MLFNSLEFALFLPAVVALYFVLPQRARTLLLLAASCLFYMAFIPAYILILAVTIAIDYLAGIWLERTEGRARVVLLVVSIVSTCAVLFVFKYFHFFTDTFVGLAALLGWTVHSPALSIILPIGLSFHTFQSLSYVIEVYYGRQKAETNLVTYATYVMFFPQLVAGPIERPQNLLHQFREHHDFDYGRVTSGLKRIAWGLFKKLVVADRLALYVSDVYAAPSRFNGLQLTIATVMFAYQIYCDFSGYSDIAIGSARILGFRLMENFKTPYHARSVSEFWHRWHISLSTWFRDYVYIPLGGNRVSTTRLWYANLMITFTLSGLWHGANWTYVAWGALNGGYLITGIATRKWRERVYGWLGLGADSSIRTAIAIATTFALTCAAWVVFRANNLADASYVFTHFWRGWDFGAISTEQFLMRQMPAAILSVAFLEAVQLIHGRISITRLIGRFPVVVRWPVYAGFVLAVVLLGVYRSSQFIYFQF
jgi:alginate O-acetyltransferase complex protein AlgI